MSSSKTKGNWKTGLTGVTLILAGVVLLGIQVSPAFANRLHKTAGTHKNWRACSEKFVPFDSYREYVPHLVKVSIPLGDRVAEMKIRIHRSVASLASDIRVAVGEARADIREGLADMRLSLRDALREAQRTMRFTLRSLPHSPSRRTLETADPEARPEHTEAAHRQAA